MTAGAALPIVHGRRFFSPLPPLSTAYPVGEHDRLLKAVLLEDRETALQLAWQWLDTNDIDIVSFREHRLLIALLARFGKALDQHRFYPRIVGLQRMLWTRKLLFLKDVRPALHAITEGGVEILLIKGASRLVDGRVGKSGRVAHDLDLVVHPSDARHAFDTLANDGWVASSGWSNARINHQIEAMRALNLYKGRFGDIDLHRYPFHPHQGSPGDDEVLWASSVRTKLDDIPVNVPNPAQQIAIAVAHGGLDSHTHSDWLCDIAEVLRRGNVNTDELEAIIEARRIETSAAIAFQYLADICQLPLDHSMLNRIVDRARRRPVQYLSQFLQTRPRDREGKLGALMRGTAKQFRMRAARKALPRLSEGNKLALRAMRKNRNNTRMTARQLETITDISGLDGKLEMQALLEISAPARRTCDFELHADERFVAHASWRPQMRLDGSLLLACAFVKPAGAQNLRLIARPRRADRLIETDADKKRYAAVPFQIMSFSVIANASKD